MLLDETQIRALKPGDKIRIGETITEVDHWHPAKQSFYTKDWFIDATGLSATCYGLDRQAEQYDIDKVPIYYENTTL